MSAQLGSRGTRIVQTTVSTVPETVKVTSRVRRMREPGRSMRTFAMVATAVFFVGGTLPGTAVKPVSALQCFSCTDCSVRGTLFAQKEQCGPSEIFCAAVHKKKRFGSIGHSSVDRGCASSLNVACISDGETVIDADAEEGTAGSKSSYQCCSTDLCNGPGEARTKGYRSSEEHRRNLMEGNPRRAARASSDGEGGAGGEKGADDDDNSAQSSRRGGSRLATVLVIVGTFSQVLWLAGSVLQ